MFHGCSVFQDVTDINECVTGNHDCDDTSTCTNLIGSFECTCNEGYEKPLITDVEDRSYCVGKYENIFHITLNIFFLTRH